MIIDPTNEEHLIADEGKLLVQKSSGSIMGYEVFLKKAFINGEYVDDFYGNYYEIDDNPELEDNNIE